MRIRLSKAIVKKLEKDVLTAQKLNNLRLYKKEQKEKLYKIIEEGPEKYGFFCGCWNSAMIQEVIQREFNVTYNVRYICSLLKKMKLSYQKAAFVSDHLDEKKREEWETQTWPKILEEAREKKAVIVFCDEVFFAQWGSLGRTWAPRGKQPKIKTTGKRKALKMFGGIEFFSGAFHFNRKKNKKKKESSYHNHNHTGT